MDGIIKKAKSNAKEAVSKHFLHGACVSFTVCVFYFIIVLLEEISLVLSGGEIYYSALNVPDISTALPSLKTAILITLCAFLLSAFVLTPLRIGEKRWYIFALKGSFDKVSSVFLFFKIAKAWFKSVRFYFFSTLLTFLWGIIFFFPSFLIFGVMMTSVFSGKISFLSSLSFTMLLPVFLLSSAIFSVFIKRYFLAEYILAIDLNFSVLGAFKRSVKLTRGVKSELFLLKLSLLCLNLLNIFVIPSFYLLPYKNAAEASFALSLLAPVKSVSPDDKTHVFPVRR